MRSKGFDATTPVATGRPSGAKPAAELAGSGLLRVLVCDTVGVERSRFLAPCDYAPRMLPKSGESQDQELELDWTGRPSREGGGQATDLQVNAPPRSRGHPGDPAHMSPELRAMLAPLLEGPRIQVRQLIEMSKVLIGWDARNQYEVSAPDGRPLGYIGETGEGIGAALLRNFWGFRTVRLELMTLDGTLALTITRPWTIMFTRIRVEAWDGRPLGTVQQRFNLLRRTFEVLSPAGNSLAIIQGPFFKWWTFEVHRQGRLVATIRKRWTNLAQEVFTDADNFSVEFDPALTDGPLRQLILAATIGIDFAFFERKRSD
jgi:uncharacterized protein YxjI